MAAPDVLVLALALVVAVKVAQVVVVVAVVAVAVVVAVVLVVQQHVKINVLDARALVREVVQIVQAPVEQIVVQLVLLDVQKTVLLPALTVVQLDAQDAAGHVLEHAQV